MKRINWKHVLLLLMVIFLLTAGTVYANSNSSNSQSKNMGHITRFVDDEAGVACWFTDNGVSCLPLEQIRLLQ